MQQLLKWYDRHKRAMPWRQTKNPYRIWISEIMLQQTQVDTVIPYYERFLTRFPTVQALARAPLETLLQFWSGLGYYSRARNLHLAAQQIVAQHGGKIPNDRKMLLALPGIGRYTVGAILSIAFGQQEPVLDGNVIRVLTRLHGIATDPKIPSTQEKLWSLAQGLARCSRPGDMNQALMELGATVCLPTQALCATCPLRKECVALATHQVENLPLKIQRQKSIKVHYVAAMIYHRGKVLLAKRPPAKHLGEMWEFPQWEIPKPLKSETIEKWLQKQLGVSVQLKKVLPAVQHSIMNRRMTVTPVTCDFDSGKLKKNGYSAYVWRPIEALSKMATSSLNLKIRRSLPESA